MIAVSIALLAVASSAAVASARASGETPTTKAEWTAALTRMTFGASDYQMIQTFLRSDPEMVYATLRDSWPQIHNAAIRQFLIQLLVNGTGLQWADGRLTDGYTPNPHLLDLLALGLDDPMPQVRLAAIQYVSGIAFKEIRSSVDMQEWRKSIREVAIGDVIDSTCAAAVRALESKEAPARAHAYRVLLSAQFHSGRYTATSKGVTTHGLTVTGLVARRRQAALKANLVGVAALGLKPDNPLLIRELAVRLIAHFAPDLPALRPIEADIQREVPPFLLGQDTSEIYELLAELKSPWVTDLLIKRIQAPDGGRANQTWAPAVALGNTGDPRAIPALIALYDTATPGDFLAQVIERGLGQLTGVPYAFNNNHDGDWWRDWWQEHKSSLPEDARNMPFPTIAGVNRPAGYSLRRHSERRTIGATAQREYWLISPGIITAPSESSKPGLMVVLADQPYSPGVARRWQELAGRLWDGKYLVALVVRKSEAGSSREPGLPELVADIVSDAENRTPIDPRRVYIYGEGSGGMDVYACSLEPKTPFHGFLVVASPFKSAQLPPLTSAKSRRYFLVHPRSSKTAPLVLAEAAETLLKQKGAAVVLEPFDEDSAGRTTGDSLDKALHRGIQWLEEGK